MLTPKKPNYGFLIFSWFIVEVGAFYFGAALPKGIITLESTIVAIGEMPNVLKHPFAAHYWNENSMACIIGVGIAFLLFFLVYLDKFRNYLPGREFGTAKWASIKDIKKRLQDQSENPKNKILSQNVKISLDTRKTGNNNNALIVGGAGTGKTMFQVLPNAMECNNSLIFTDPKGELIRELGNYLKSQGYVIKELNLISERMAESNGYNPFQYIENDTDVIRLITNLIANTTPKGSTSNDPFWEKAESLYLQALFYYVLKEYPIEKRNFNSLVGLLSEAEVNEDGTPSALDNRMEELAAKEGGEEHPAVINYRKCIRGAGDTVRSIIISANSRFAFFSNPDLQKILEKDEMDIPFIGMGIEGDKKTKTALFCVIPDNDKSYNFMVGMLYTQIFQQLYYCADFLSDGRLPIPVEFWMDEFANGVTRSTPNTVGITDKSVA